MTASNAQPKQKNGSRPADSKASEGRRQSSGRNVSVALPGLRKPLSYFLEDSLAAEFLPEILGSEVTVEVGRREANGWVVALGDGDASLPVADDDSEPSAQGELFLGLAGKREIRLKLVRSIRPAFLPEQMPLFEWMAEYYGVPVAEILESALPSREPMALEEYLAPSKTLRDEWTRSQAELRQKFRRSKSQWALLEYLFAQPGVVPKSVLNEAIPGASRLLSVLEEKGCIERTHVETAPKLSGHAPPRKPEVSLTKAQSSALASVTKALDSRAFSPLLLFGVTGSGKTEVYLRAIEKVLREGGGALVIVPEISLTPQLYDEFESRLGQPIALLHSEVGRRSRWQSWEGLLRGNLRVAVGARSAVFAPVQNLRLIIVDEEHESSYKQSDNLRYHARDVAVMRAKLLRSTILLGSATPSFESLVNVQQSRYKLVEMPERVTDRSLPAIELVDLNTVRRKAMVSPNISPALFDAMSAALARNGQVVILYNRRGFASYLQCATCQEVVNCPHCSIAMTYHKKRDRLLCHYCNESTVPPKLCGLCRDPRTTAVIEPESEEGDRFGELKQRGSGTEHLVEELQSLFPSAVIERMDRDTVGKKDSYRRILGRMRSGEANILVGTQMIAKGHDLPGVTVVGVIDADIGLHTPDFRSSEKTFQLITQAAGRAGRGSEPGRVIIQTRQPKHPTIVATLAGRFKAFARYELDYRKELGYPPWGRLMRLVISSPKPEDAFQAARLTRAEVTTLLSALEEAADCRVLGPAPAPHERLRGRYRWHILVKSKSARALSRLAEALDRWKDSVKYIDDFRLVVDIDPVDML